MKRALANPGADEMVARARASVDRPLSVLLDEVRSSLDYYRNQPGSAQLRRVVVTGGSAQLPGLPERLSALVGVPVEPAYMHDLLRIGDIGFAPEELPRLEPYLPAPVGLALGGAGVGTIIDLRPRNRATSSKSRTRLDRRVVAGALVGVVALAGATYLARNDVSGAKAKNTKAQDAVKTLRSQLYLETQGPANGGGAASASAAALKAEVVNALGQDVVWPAIIENIGAKLPPGVLLTSFTGTHTIPVALPAGTVAPTTPAAPTPGTTGATAPTAAAAAVANPNDVCAGLVPPAGTVAMNGTAPGLNSVSALLDSLKSDTDLTVLWATTAHAAADGHLEFTITASLGSTARGHRLETFFKGEPCK